MKIKDGFVLREIAGQSMAVPVGKRVNDLHGMIALNETGAFLWKALISETDTDSLVQLLESEYEVSTEKAVKSVNNFIMLLKEENLLEGE